MEYFDVCDENGNPTGEIVERKTAHSKGILHRTVHVWIIRKKEAGFDVLLQKRSDNKDSYPGLYDTSAAGHVTAGDEPFESAQRELFEELGISAAKEDLILKGTIRIKYEEEFNGKVFSDNEIAHVYVYEKPVDIASLNLQEEEVSEVKWFDLEEAYRERMSGNKAFCFTRTGMRALLDHLGIEYQ